MLESGILVEKHLGDKSFKMKVRYEISNKWGPPRIPVEAFIVPNLHARYTVTPKFVDDTNTFSARLSLRRARCNI